jgi:hypothetical protein
MSLLRGTALPEFMKLLKRKVKKGFKLIRKTAFTVKLVTSRNRLRI